MYILLLIVMVKPIKLYTSVLIAKSDWNSQKHWGRRWRDSKYYIKNKDRERERDRETALKKIWSAIP